VVCGVNSAKVEMKNATLGSPSHLCVFTARSCSRAFAHRFAVSAFACHGCSLAACLILFAVVFANLGCAHRFAWVTCPFAHLGLWFWCVVAWGRFCIILFKGSNHTFGQILDTFWLYLEIPLFWVLGAIFGFAPTFYNLLLS
jgi:hypothetical protein